jgi:predicted nucleotidyltransferase
MTGRTIARLGGISLHSCQRALKELVELGVVEEVGTGRANLYRLKSELQVVREALFPLFTYERTFAARVREEIARVGRKLGVSLVLFGSAARREETPKSDLDIAVISRDGLTEKEEKALGELAARLSREFGVVMVPYIVQASYLKARYRRRDPFALAVVSGEVLAGDVPAKD